MPNQIELRSLRVFICHATEDKTMVHELDRQLKKEKWINLWLAEEKLLPGQDWAHEIPKAVRSSDVVIICLSQKSVKKEGYVQKEIRIALDAAEEKPDETIFIIPVRVDDCKVPNKLSRWQWTEYFGSEKNRKKGIKRLLASLKLRAEALGIRPDIHKEKVQGVLESHPTDPDDLYEQGIAIERLLKKKISLNERKQLKEQLENIKVDRIQSLLSDKPRYVTIAKKRVHSIYLAKSKAK